MSYYRAAALARQQHLDRLISGEPITVCIRCSQTAGQVDAERTGWRQTAARCLCDALGEHEWWTGTRSEWFAR